jgi:hypothetical protein
MDALRATYADIKTVRTRKVYQIVFEGPIEEMGMAMALFGPPSPDAEVWAGIARLRPEAARSEPENKARPLSQIAAFHCNKPLFRQFLAEKIGKPVHGADEAADVVREQCGVRSRTELDSNEVAARHFRNLKADFDLWMRADA